MTQAERDRKRREEARNAREMVKTLAAENRALRDKITELRSLFWALDVLRNSR
jgi:hypothetical protein